MRFRTAPSPCAPGLSRTGASSASTTGGKSGWVLVTGVVHTLRMGLFDRFRSKSADDAEASTGHGLFRLVDELGGQASLTLDLGDLATDAVVQGAGGRTERRLLGRSCLLCRSCSGVTIGPGFGGEHVRCLRRPTGPRGAAWLAAALSSSASGDDRSASTRPSGRRDARRVRTITRRHSQRSQRRQLSAFSDVQFEVSRGWTVEPGIDDSDDALGRDLNFAVDL